MSKLIYIASPYSSFREDPHEASLEMEDRYRQVLSYLSHVNNNNEYNYMYYSPIVHFHQLSMEYNMPTDAEFWKCIDKVMLDKSDEMNVLMIRGWMESKGVQSEINYFRSVNKLITLTKWT